MTHVCEYSDGLGDPPAAIALRGGSAEVDRAGGGGRLAGVVAVGRGVAVAELTGVVEAPSSGPSRWSGSRMCGRRPR